MLDEEESDVDESSWSHMEKDEMNLDESKESVQYVGPLTVNQRLEKVRKYWRKKYNKANTSKYHYICRQQVAEKRLRIKGRFVTKEQACEILGLTQNDLLDNVKI